MLFEVRLIDLPTSQVPETAKAVDALHRPSLWRELHGMKLGLIVDNDGKYFTVVDLSCTFCRAEVVIAIGDLLHSLGF